ncbi:MAG TPA: hypothetical protein VN544_10520 [Gaiellaceae bacterium]|nr:hypothetical protein [Gaiellaceae bacterium]
MKGRSLLATVATMVALLAALSGPAMADTIPAPGTPGQPLASGQLSGSDSHGVLHCQAAADLFIDPTLPPGSAPGSIVVTPNGLVFAGPRDGLCAQIYTALTGQQP